MSDEAANIYCMHAGPVDLKDEGKVIANDYDRELFNDYGFVVRAKADTGEDIHLWSFIYQQQGAEIIVDGDVGQTLLIYGKFTEDEKQTMHPMAMTVNKGQNIEDYYPPGSIKIREGKDQVTWELGGRLHQGSPPEWHVSGEHAGVKLDIHFTQDNNAFYHCGKFEDLDKTNSAGFIVHTRTKGSIEVHGKTLKFSNGFGLHERIIQRDRISDRTGYMAGRGLHWMHGWSEDFTWYLMRGDVGAGMSTAMINIGNQQILLEDPTSSGVEEVAQWIDPTSKILSPYKWRVWVRTENGTLESRIYAYARQYYTWIRRGGTLVVNQYCANADSTFTYKDGRKVESKQMISIEHMRTLYRQLSSFESK